MRIALGVLGSKPDLNKNVGDLILSFRAGGIQVVNIQPLRNDVLNFFARASVRDFRACCSSSIKLELGLKAAER